MNKPNDKSATPSDGGAMFIKREPTPRDVVPKGPTEDAITGPISPSLAQHAVSASPVAAKGDDDLMSQPVTDMNLPSANQIKGKWKHKVGTAKTAWVKLTGDEFLQYEGRLQKQVGLVPGTLRHHT